MGGQGGREHIFESDPEVDQEKTAPRAIHHRPLPLCLFRRVRPFTPITTVPRTTILHPSPLHHVRTGSAQVLRCARRPRGTGGTREKVLCATVGEKLAGAPGTASRRRSRTRCSTGIWGRVYLPPAVHAEARYQQRPVPRGVTERAELADVPADYAA